MSGSTSFNLMNKLNEADTNAIEIKKKVFIEGSNVRVEETNLKKQQMNESENLLKESKVIWSDQIDTSEETYNAEWRDAGYSSAEEAIADGFPDYDAWIEGDRYSESEILLDDLKNNILPQIENQANLDYIFLTGNYNSNYPDFRPSGSGGVTLKGIDELNDYLAKWDSVTIFEEDGNIGVKCTDHDGSVELMLYTFATDNEEELAKMLGYTEDNFDEFENDLYYKSIDTSTINDHPEAIKPIADTITAFNESEEAIKKDLNIEPGSDEEAELDNILDTNYNDLFDNLDDEEKEEYNKIAATIRDLKPEEALIDIIDEIKNKAKENGLEEDLLLFAYLNKRKINEAATDLPTEQSDEDRLASLKVQLAKDGDQLADDEKESIEKEIADLEAKLFPIDETDESKGKIKKSFEESVTQKDLPDNCYDFNDNTNQIIIIKKGQTGYYPTDIEFENKEQAEDIINKANEALKVTPEQRDAMRAASMSGWNTTDNITEGVTGSLEEDTKVTDSGYYNKAIDNLYDEVLTLAQEFESVDSDTCSKLNDILSILDTIPKFEEK